MAPWPKLENAQHNPNKYIEGATSQQPATAVKDKEPNESKCPHLTPDWPPVGTPRDLGPIPHSSRLLLFVWADDTGTSITKIGLLPSHSTVTLIEEPPEKPAMEEDPWDLPELKQKGTKWSGENKASWGGREGMACRQEVGSPIFSVPSPSPWF